MHTKLKGDLGEFIVAQTLLERGWHIAFPYVENLKYDLIAAVDLQTRQIYFIPSARMRRALFNIRLSKPKNSQKRGIHFAEEFTNFV